VALIATRGLTRDFGGLRAVDRVDFELPEGEIRAVIGPNGAGKTTFVGLLCGRVRPSAGRVLWQGRDVTALPAHRRVRLGIAYTFQITSVFGNLSLAENVALAVRRRGVADPEGETLLALDRVGLSGRAGEKANAQSYGHRRLLELAMGLALRPRLLILDEPTQGLAAGEIDRFVGLVRDVATGSMGPTGPMGPTGATVLLIEHNMDVVMTLAERITVLERGAVLAEGTPADIRGSRAVQAAYLGA
jgi:branched-chain amino acid transport system ATP-binding protein